ncbi:murein L,D-transpeptidase catalytic domain family protein [Longitalea arenae]|uniref:murein L,D-transpeptidase catalytic domain family protein n=1 Tax=Longitalea arenae TaxID=2812558 RepID=UPI001967D89E|nr:murein L,D-transpeptidase catalytic domain family protein [Longitalea arenae]
MRKPLIVKPGKRLCLAMAFSLVALCATVPVQAGTGAGALFSDTSATPATSSFFSIKNKLNVYDSLHLDAAGLSKKIFTMALKGMAKLVRSKQIKDNLLAIVDFSQPSVNKRLYVIDLNACQLLFNTWVAHGMKTGKEKAVSFSNKPASNKSSLGFYVTGYAYQGSNGYSLKLKGMEKGINDYAMRRGIVIHGADYVNEDLINSQGYIGRSWGCPAVAPELSQQLIDLLKEGSCLFIYHPSTAYLSRSQFVR